MKKESKQIITLLHTIRNKQQEKLDDLLNSDAKSISGDKIIHLYEDIIGIDAALGKIRLENIKRIFGKK